MLGLSGPQVQSNARCLSIFSNFEFMVEPGLGAQHPKVPALHPKPNTAGPPVKSWDTTDH